MSGVNKAIILGTMGRDPEVRMTPNGQAVCQLSIATSYKPKSGEEQTEWHRVVLFDKLAEVAGQYTKKGRQVYIEGRLRTRKWQDKDGQDKYTTEIMGDVLQLIGPKDESAKPAPKTHGQMKAEQRGRPAGGFDDMDSESIPF